VNKADAHLRINRSLLRCLVSLSEVLRKMSAQRKDPLLAEMSDAIVDLIHDVQQDLKQLEEPYAN
jgi:hypothetical protein